MVFNKFRRTLLVCAVIVGSLIIYKELRATPVPATSVGIPLSADYFHAKCWDINHLESKIAESEISLKRSLAKDMVQVRESNTQLKALRTNEIARYNTEARRLKDPTILDKRGLPSQLNDAGIHTNCTRGL